MFKPALFRQVVATAFLLCASIAAADEAARTISVSGTGSASTEPDRARLNMSIVVRDPSLQVAQGQAGQVAQRVLAMTDALDIDRKRVDTTGASVRPDYKYDRKTGESTFNGYIATRNIVVVVKDLEKLAALVEGSVDAGVNQVSPPQLFSSTRQEAYRQALENAAEDARANAERLAGALGIKLGSAVSVNASPHASPMPQPRMMNAMAMEADAGASYNVGDQEIRASVNVVFAIED